MRPLSVACYVLAVLGLALSAQVGWAAAVVACVALAAAVVLMALEARWKDAIGGMLATSNQAASEAAKATEDVKRMRTELHAALERFTKQQRGF